MLKRAPVSVVIPCYNCAGTLSRAVDSAINQSLPPAEIILVDDASTDETGVIVKRLADTFPHLVRALFLPANAGPSVARNAGWDCARSPYIAFLDADDAWHRQKLAVQAGWLDAHPEALMCGHVCAEYREGLEEYPCESVEVRYFSLRDMLISNRFSTPAVMLRRETPFRFPEGKKHAEDYQLWLSIAAKCPQVGRIELPLAWYYKSAYGASGLSAALWKMELGELDAIGTLYRSGNLSTLERLVFSGFSLLKFLRRILLVSIPRLWAARR